MYVSYDFYKQTFGDTIPEADFSKVEAKAEAVIGYLTYINGDIFAKEDNRVKLAVCAAAEVVHYHNNQASANGNQAAGVKSETNDGYSVTYITEGQDGQTAEELLRKKILEAVRVYLLPTGWLSRSLKGGSRWERRSRTAGATSRRRSTASWTRMQPPRRGHSRPATMCCLWRPS